MPSEKGFPGNRVKLSVPREEEPVVLGEHKGLNGAYGVILQRIADEGGSTVSPERERFMVKFDHICQYFVVPRQYLSQVVKE